MKLGKHRSEKSNVVESRRTYSSTVRDRREFGISTSFLLKFIRCEHVEKMNDLHYLTRRDTEKIRISQQLRQ